jgi:hypothetical protein
MITRKKIPRRLRVIIFSAAFILVTFMFFRMTRNKTAAVFNTLPIEEGEGISYEYNSGSAFYSYRSKDFFFCAKDGMHIFHLKP